MVTCPNCRTDNPDDAAFCSHCETYLRWSDQPEPDAPPTSIAIQLAADALSVTPGTETGCTVWVRNRATTPVDVTIELYDSAATWSSVEPATLLVPGGGQARAHIRLLPPATGATEEGPRRLGVRATPDGDPTAAVSAEAVVSVAAVVEFQLRIDPTASTTHRAATHRAIVDNIGNAPVSVELTANDDSGALHLELDDEHLDVAANSTAETALAANVTRPKWIGRNVERPFTVTARDGRIPARHATATVTITPRLPTALAVIVSAVVVTAMLLIGVITAALDDDTDATPTTPPTVPTTVACTLPPTLTSATGRLVGLSEVDARQAAEACGWRFRVTRRDDENLQITLDLVFNRVNVAVTGGTVTEVLRVETPPNPFPTVAPTLIFQTVPPVVADP